MSHPFAKLPTDLRKKLFWISASGSIILMVLSNMVGGGLITDAAPYGIISFEFAGSPSQAQAIIDSWNSQARLSAAFSLGLDYLFILAYSTAISLACLWTADMLQERNWPLARLGVPLAWGQWLAGALDAVENLGLVLLLLYSAGNPWPGIAKWCALIKFTLVFLGLVYAFYGLVVYLVTRRGLLK